MRILYVISIITISSLFAAPSLNTFDFRGAQVIPLIKKGSEEWILLGREAAGKDRGTYDSFGGSRGTQEKYPVDTAAREFYEELILSSTLGMSLFDVQEYLDLGTGNTAYILAVEYKQKKIGNVAYITNLAEEKCTKISNTFAQARARATRWEEQEKDSLALILLSDLKKVIFESYKNSGVEIKAQVVGTNGSLTTQTIVLRPFFVSLMRPFLENDLFVEGVDKRIRFYTVP